MSKENIQIKQIKHSDFMGVLSLWKKAGLGLDDEKIELLTMQMVVKINPTSCLVLIKDKIIIGAALGTFNGKRGWIYHLAIHPDYQQAGFGALLLKRIEQELKKKGAHRVHLGVEYTNLKVLPFYEKSGYSVVNDALWLGKNI